MTSSDSRSNQAGTPPREVPVDWEALEDAFENNAPEVHSYLHLESGEVLRVVDGIADPEMHSRIVADSNYMRIESVSSREQYRWMERFIQMVDDAALRNLLARAIDGKGAFRRFKDVLMAHSAERERWFAFRSERLRVFMEAWLAAHALTAVGRAEWAPEEGAGAEASHPADDSSPQETAAATSVTPPASEPERSRTSSDDTLKSHILEVLERLSTTDLRGVATYAEFLLHRAEAVSARPVGTADESTATKLSRSDTPPPSESRTVSLVR